MGPNIIHAISQDTDQTVRRCMKIRVICKLNGTTVPIEPSSQGI